MEFSPTNNIVQRCIQGMIQEAQNNPEEAAKVFLQAWNEASNDFEKFLAAHFTARHQHTTADKLHWLETALQCALRVDDVAVKSALPTLYTNLARCYEALNDAENAAKNHALATSSAEKVTDNGPFYHGTKADLQVGDLLVAGGRSNYQSEVIMNHIYFTGLLNGAGLAASMAKGEGRERVYIVEPTGPFESDPNLTDKKFPGNLTRSYRSEAPLKIVGEIADWTKQSAEEIQQFRDRLDKQKGEIIN